jgi:hypothetical protein
LLSMGLLSDLVSPGYILKDVLEGKDKWGGLKNEYRRSY